MTTTETYPMSDWIERTVVDSSGDEIGTIDAIYLDDETGDPAWIAVKTGRISSRIAFVPLDGASRAGDCLQVSVTKKQARAPRTRTPTDGPVPRTRPSSTATTRTCTGCVRARRPGTPATTPAARRPTTP